MTFLSASLQLDDGFQIEFGVCVRKNRLGVVYVYVCAYVFVYEYEDVFSFVSLCVSNMEHL